MTHTSKIDSTSVIPIPRQVASILHEAAEHAQVTLADYGEVEVRVCQSWGSRDNIWVRLIRNKGD